MNIERRTLLKGMALGGLAGAAMGAFGLAMTKAMLGGQAQPLPTLVLVDGEAAGAAFLAGVGSSPAASKAEVQRTDLGLDFVLGLEKRLRSGQQQRIIGLVDDASAALILDLARSSGARVQWLGQHSAAAGSSRHRLLSADSAQGCSLRLGQQLHACGGGFSLSEQHPLGGQPLNLAGAARSGGSAQWAASIGHDLASLGGDDSSAAPRIANHYPALTGQFVSFSILV
uniref:PcuX n=1 Tax=Ectopseudomonas mendocina TaxID=300 RepID=Q8KP41_ECTME|nr:PcuX [Pseudomonas mendocina]